jgi:hypothetical protein
MMNKGHTGFSQQPDCLRQYEFDKCVRRYRGNFRVRKLPGYEPFAPPGRTIPGDEDSHN